MFRSWSYPSRADDRTVSAVDEDLVAEFKQAATPSRARRCSLVDLQ